MNSTGKSLQHTLLATALLAAFGFSSSAALAQEQAAPDNNKSAQNDRSKTSEKTEATTLGAITVTAQKRSQDARKVPSSISVVDSEQLENQHVSSLIDLAGSLPSVYINSGGGPGRTSVTIRGIPSLGAGAVVGTYVDDTPLGSSANFARAPSFMLDLLPYDIERIEVLRGPQGTLYGASTMGGLLKYVLKEPELDHVAAEVGGGISTIDGAHDAGYDGRAKVDLPLIRGKLGLSLSVSKNRTPGYVDNVFTGQDDINAVAQKSGRAALLWKPNDDVSVKVSALHQSVNAHDQGVIFLDPATEKPLYGNQKTASALPQPFRKQVNFYSGTLNWDLHWADFTSATSYSDTATHNIEDDSVTYGPIYPLLGFPEGLSAFKLDLNLKKVTQEFRLASKPGDHVEWLLGAFYTRESSKNRQVETAQANDGTPIAGLDPLFVGSIPSIYKEGAVFGNLTYKFNNSFDITGGLRFARNEQDFEQRITGGGGLLIALGVSPGHSAENVLTWLLSPAYHVNDNNMLYLRAASGYRPGGPNFALPGVPPTVKSDKLINYEAGWKSLLFDKRVSVDFAVYDINWRGIQLSTATPNGSITYLANGGSAVSRGAELSTAFMPTHNLRLGLNASFTDAFLSEDAPSLNGNKGDKLPGIPRYNWAYTTDYYFQLPSALSGHVGGSYRWIGERSSRVSGSPFSHSEGSFGVLNVNADISRDAWTLRLYVKNLTNEHPSLNIGYLQNGLTNAIETMQTSILQPRTVGVEFDVQF